MRLEEYEWKNACVLFLTFHKIIVCKKIASRFVTDLETCYSVEA